MCMIELKATLLDDDAFSLRAFPFTGPIPHPRWPQNREKMIGTNAVRATLPYNGYGEYVAKMYR